MASYSRLVVFGLAVLTTACNSMQHSEAKLEARQRWNTMRGRVKQGLAEQEYNAGRFGDAVKTITESIALEPNQADAYTLLARANLELGKAASAQEALDAAGRLELSTADLTYMQGVILEQRGKLEDAATRYAQARKIDPRNVDYLVAEAESLVALGRPGEALNLVDDNADAIDDCATVSTLGAHIAALLGQVEGALGRYEKALIAQGTPTPPFAGARIPSRTAPVQSEMGITPQSKLFSGASKLIVEEFGRLLAGADRWDEAVAVLRPLLDSPDERELGGGVRRALAASYLSTGNPALAEEVLLEYAPAHPDDTLAQLLLAKAAIAVGDILTALGAVDRAQQREPDRPELWLVRATVNWKRGRLAAAASDLYDVLQNSPNDIEAHCLLAEVLRAQQRLESARSHFQSALRISEDCAWASAGLKALQNAGRLEPARQPARLTSAAAEAIPTGP